MYRLAPDAPRVQVAYAPEARQGRAGTSPTTHYIKLATIQLNLGCRDLQWSARPKPRHQPLQERGVYSMTREPGRDQAMQEFEYAQAWEGLCEGLALVGELVQECGGLPVIAPERLLVRQHAVAQCREPNRKVGPEHRAAPVERPAVTVYPDHIDI